MPLSHFAEPERREILRSIRQLIQTDPEIRKAVAEIAIECVELTQAVDNLRSHKELVLTAFATREN